MNTPQRDPLSAMFDQFAAATAAETTRSTTGQLRRRMRRHRTTRVAAAGVAAAVLAVPGGWMLQQAGASDGPTGAADTGEAPPCLEDGRYAILAEGTTVEDYLAADSMSGGIVFTGGEDIETIAADPTLYRLAQRAQEAFTEFAELDDHYLNAERLEAELPESAVVVEFYGTFEQGAPVEVLYPCEETPVESPSEGGGTPTDEPTGSYEPSASDEPTGTDESTPGYEPTDAGEEPTHDGDATPSWEEPTTGADEVSPSGGEEPSEHSTP
ncbi:hypothetical protein [Glycomyces sp. NPDC021274]|uniref:hypothetical protein n=1 Tax=Glycomyces sp. NPDC021274 TaxID=3155120 RepID=UPI0033E0892B